MTRTIITTLIASMLGCWATAAANPVEGVEWEATAIANASTGDFAPSLIASLQHGKLTQQGSALLDVKAERKLRLDERFSWGAAVEGISGYTTYADYARWDDQSQSWTQRSAGPAAAWLQQLYAEVKYRGVFLTVGMKEHGSALLDNALTSGDLVESGNSRPAPEARVGFIDFQDMPFTQGWVQIQGEISYGKMMDDSYLKHHYNYYSYHLTLGSLYTYKRCYFRSNPRQPLSVTAGMQVGGIFGGTTTYYSQGAPQRTLRFSRSVRSMIKMFLPMGENGEDFYEGSSMGSWDFHARYRLGGGHEVAAYFQWPWEDGSSIGRRNGWDGLWGLQYERSDPGIVTGAVIEYIDFRDQSGPVHWSPSDTPGTTIAHEATGRDDYYNNNYYNSYAYYGMAIGTPFMVSPIYNLDGYPAFACNRVNGWHVGVKGCISSQVSYRVLASRQRGLGTYRVPYASPRTCTAVMAEALWDAQRVLPGLSVKAQAAIDRGSLRGNSAGVMLSLTYRGKL